MIKLLNSINGGRINGNQEILDMKINNEIIWSSVYNKFLVRYRVKQNTSYKLNSLFDGISQTRPTFTLSDGTSTFLEDNMTIYLHDGTTTNNTDTLLSDISIVEIEYNENVQKISFENNLLVTDISLGRCDRLTDMSYMFSGCMFLKNLYVPKWDTDNVTDMSYMFSGCRVLQHIDVSKWNISNVTDMSYIFNDCRALRRLDVSKWNTTNVINMSNMFNSCLKLSNLDLSSWDTNNVTDMSYMFYRCKSITELFISNFNTDRLVNINQIFRGCSSLKKIDISNWNTDNISNKEYIFINTKSLYEIRIANISSDTINYVISQIEKRSSSSYGSIYYSLKDGSDTNDVDYTTAKSKYWSLYRFCIIFKSSNRYLRINDNRVYPNSYENSGLYIYRADFDVTSFSFYSSTESFNSQLTEVSTLINSTVTDLDNAFTGCSKLSSVNLSNLNTGKVKSFTSMFYDCSSLASLDVSKFNTNNVTKLSGMFYNCSLLTIIDVSNWVVSVTDMSNIFYGCSSLASLNLSSWDTNNVTNITDMLYLVPDGIEWYYDGYNYRDFVHSEWCTNYSGIFPWDESKLVAQYTYKSSFIPVFNNDFEYYVRTKDNKDGTHSTKIICKKFTMPQKISFKDETSLISIEYLNTSEVGDMSFMLSGCTSLTSIDVSRWNTDWNTNWNTGTAHNMSYMFSGCTSLTELVIPNFDTYEVTTMRGMFSGCTSLTNVRGISNWDTVNVKDMGYMFSNCVNLSNVYFSSIDIEGNYHSINTTNVKDMGYMFKDCTSLNSIDLTNFDTSNVITSEYMFSGVLPNTDISVSSGWTLSELETSFDGQFRKI